MPLDTMTSVSTYLTFTLGEEQYAIDVVKAREVLEITPITRVPRTPGFMRGVINLRGSVVPVCDMKTKFGMGETAKTVDSRVVVMEIEFAGQSEVIGVLADSVQEVIELEPGQIEAPPRIGMSINTEFIRGMGKRNDKFIIILDMDRVFSKEDLAGIAEAKGDAPSGEVADGSPSAAGEAPASMTV